VSVVSGGFTYEGAEDSGNNFFELGRRYLVPKTMALILQDAYGYTISQQPSFYHAGSCYLIGSPNADTISVIRNGSNILTSSIDLGVDVPGTGPLAGAGDAGAFVATFDLNAAACTGANYPTVYAGAGNDNITVNGGSFRIYAHAENGNDVISNTGTSAGYLYGEIGADSITSLSSNDFIYGDVGNDTIWAGGGADFVDGGDDADSIEGQSGNDSLYGGKGNDTINGGNDDDYIEGGLGADLMHGNAGNDQFQANDGTGTDTMFGDAGADTLLGSNPGDVFTQ
jgi:Ca2+-binding RTX toxin-like protein